MKTMRATLVTAEFAPRPGYKISQDEIRTRKVREGHCRTAIQRITEFIESLHKSYPSGIVPQVWPTPGDFKY